jgi:RHS repeat-associated protein
MTRVAHIKRSTDKPRHGTQLPLPGLGLPDRPAPLLLEEKGLGDEVHATKERPLLNLTYSYDEENNITGISNSAFAVNGLGGNYGYNYEYDAMYRLTGAYGGFTDNNDNDFTFELAMSYSPSGNILSKSMDALTFQSTMGGVVAVNYNNNYQYHPAKPHAISSITGSGTDHQMEWDANGNLTHHVRTGDGNESLRQLCWDEENRLTAVRDQNHLSAYIYDAGGERVWKLTGQVQQMQIGGGGVVDVVDLNNKTLYASPYLVYNEQGYSKHYYAGAERVSSRIGGGMQNALVDPLNSALAHLSDHDNYNAIASDLYDMLMRAAECAGMTRKYVSMALDFGIIYETTGWSSPEPNWYIYHSDHLGSSAFLTDAAGDPTQHLQYMPFGETFVEQRSITSYYTPYTFSAKERDTETGYSYFGARYYDADISVWLSVDPMAHERSWLSPYNYCRWRPIVLCDPTGKLDGWIEDKDGNVSWDNSTNSQEEFERNYKDRQGYKYVSDPSNPNSYTLPNGDGRIVMNYWWEAKPESGIGMVGISMEFIPTQANSESGWTQTYLSNVPYVDSETLYRTLPVEIAEERLDGPGVVGETDVTKSAYFDSPKSNKLEDMPVRAKLPGAKYNVIMTFQSSMIVNGVKSFSIGWGFEITGDNSANSFAPTILKSNTNFHNQAVNNLINR